MIKIYPSVLNGTLKAPASKAHAQRLIFMSSLATKQGTVNNVPACRDIDTALSCIESFGGKYEKNGSSVTVFPFAKTNPLAQRDFFFSDSATCSRFTMAICAALGFKARCRASAGLSKRPVFNLTSRLALRGVNFTSFSLPFEMQGSLQPGDYVLRGDEGSQFISALLIALPLLSGDSTITLSSPIADRTFIDITVDNLKDFGIQIEETENGFRIPGRQIYENDKELQTENDWGLASFWITAGAFGASKGGNVTVTDLPAYSHQKYRDLAPMLCLVEQDFSYFNIDACNYPNLATVFAAAALVKGSSVEVEGIPQLKSKETDRLKAMKDIAMQFGGAGTIGESSMIITGGKDGIGEEDVIDCKGDPWIFLSFAACCGLIDHPILLDGEGCAEKIYGDFLRDFESLGGKYEII